MKLKTSKLVAGIMAGGLLLAASPASAAVIGWNFTDLNATFDTGTPANFTVGTISISNSLGTVTTPIAATSVSSGYTGATGGGNIGNAVATGAFNSSTTAYYAVTFTPSAGYSLSITEFDFGARSTATGPQAFGLYSSVDGYASPLVTGTIANNSTWALKDNSAFSLNGLEATAVTLRLYTYGGTGSPASGTINNRVDDIAITVSAVLVPEPASLGILAIGALGLLRRRK